MTEDMAIQPFMQDEPEYKYKYGGNVMRDMPLVFTPAIGVISVVHEPTNFTFDFSPEQAMSVGERLIELGKHMEVWMKVNGFD